MRKMISASALAIATIIPGHMMAQEVPAALDGMGRVNYEGTLGGMDIWTREGSADVFMISADGRTIIRGNVFNSRGRDIGSVYTGADPVSLVEPSPAATSSADASAPDGIFRAPESVTEEPFENKASAETEKSEPGVSVSGTGSGFSDMRSANACLSPVLPRGGTPEKDTADRSGMEAAPVAMEEQAQRDILPSAEADRPIDGGKVAQTAQEALADFDDDERRGLLLELVNNLNAADTQEAFVEGVVEWRKQIDEMRASKGLPAYFDEDASAPASADTVNREAERSDQGPSASQEDSSEGSTTEESIVTPDTTADDNPAGPLLEDARQNSLWFSLGANDAPTVYAFIDPTCPYCARAISVLSERIGDGELQLRIILAPVVSERAPGVIAGIFNADNPPLAFFDHEIDKDNFGRSDLKTGVFEELPQPLQAGVRRNYEMIANYGIPGVPFFVYETEDGAEAFSGVPEGISFPGALNDPYTGTN